MSSQELMTSIADGGGSTERDLGVRVNRGSGFGGVIGEEEGGGSSERRP